MNRFEYLFAGLMNQTEEVNLAPKEYYEFNVKDRVIVVEQGDVLIITPPNPETGRSRRHILTNRDPYGVAEAISSVVPQFDCTVQSPTKLRIYDGAQIRQFANQAGVFARTIIRYSLKRIFADNERDQKATIKFEDDFIYANRDDLRNMEIPAEIVIFKAAAEADKMYFIEKGEVAINTAQNKLIAMLGSGDCFGESVLLGEGKRTAAAVARSEVDLWAIEGEFARRELNLEHPMTQFVTLLLLRQVVMLNQLRGFR